MKSIVQIFILLLIPSSLSGQLTPVTNQYVLNPLTINPAYAGNRGAFNIAAFYRRQWVGIAKAPETMTLAMDVPLFASKLGLGLIVTNDKFGVTKETQISSNYAYKIETREGVYPLGWEQDYLLQILPGQILMFWIRAMTLTLQILVFILYRSLVLEYIIHTKDILQVYRYQN